MLHSYIYLCRLTKIKLFTSDFREAVLVGKRKNNLWNSKYRGFQLSVVQVNLVEIGRARMLRTLTGRTSPRQVLSIPQDCI